MICLLISTAALAQSSKEKLITFLFDSKAPGVRTEAFILQGPNTQIKRFDVGNEETKHLLWSMSKSISSLIFGALEDRGIVSRNDSIYKYLKSEIDAIGGKRARELKKIQLIHLLTMSSGLDWNELYEDDPFNSDIVRLLYAEFSKNAVHYILNRDLKFQPGTHFYYSSGDTHLLMGALQKAVPKERADDYPWFYFFDPIQMPAIVERDKQGVFAGSSYIYLTTGQLMKLAEFVLNHGRYQGKQVLSVEYMQFFTTVSLVNKLSCDETNYTYGASVWLNMPCPVTSKKRHPNLPENLVMFLGHGGQSISIFPEHNAYAIRIARDELHAFDFTRYLELVQGALDEN